MRSIPCAIRSHSSNAFFLDSVSRFIFVTRFSATPASTWFSTSATFPILVALICLWALIWPPMMLPNLPDTTTSSPASIWQFMIAFALTHPSAQIVHCSKNFALTFPFARINPFPFPCIPFFKVISRFACRSAPSTNPSTKMDPFSETTDTPDPTFPRMRISPRKQILPVELVRSPSTTNSWSIKILSMVSTILPLRLAI